MLAFIHNDPYPIAGSPSDGSEPVALRSIEVVAVHSSIYNRFTKKHCVEGLMSYQKTREVCSLDDMAMNFVMANQINAFFDNWLVGNPDYRHKYIDDAFRTSVSKEEEVEYGKVISFHAKQSHVIDTVEAFLKPEAYKKAHSVGSYEEDCAVEASWPGLTQCDKAALTYRVVAYQSSIYIVVEEGFLEQMEDKTSKLKFISDILKTAYAAMPVNTVNCSQWYSIYLDALRASTPQ